MPDGTRILYAEDRGLAIADLGGSEPQIVTPTQCPVGTVTNCPNLGGSLSPDGTRLAYTLMPGSQGDASVVAIFDLATAQIRLLEETRTTGLNLGCDTAANQGFNELPVWSPDGTTLVVTRQSMGPRDENGMCRSMVYTVHADGTDFQVVVPSDPRREPFNASWSPDGSHILFHASTHSGGGDGETCDIAVVRTDGTDLRQLTSDGTSCTPRWTRDSRILFSRWVDSEAGTFDLWIMDPDGTNETRLSDRSLASLSAVGCVACPAPPGTNWSDVLWQPIR
jgi:Tol biopolymer transport system component